MGNKVICQGMCSGHGEFVTSSTLFVTFIFNRILQKALCGAGGKVGHSCCLSQLSGSDQGRKPCFSFLFAFSISYLTACHFLFIIKLAYVNHIGHESNYRWVTIETLWFKSGFPLLWGQGMGMTDGYRRLYVIVIEKYRDVKVIPPYYMYR